MAARPSCPSMSIVAKPLHSPEKMSLTSLIARTGPYLEKRAVTLSSVEDRGNPLMKIVINDISRASCGQLDCGHVSSLRTFRALGFEKLDFLSFRKGTVSIAYDRTEVDKQIFAAFSLDKTKSLAAVEPFDGSGLSLCHLDVYLKKNSINRPHR